MFLKQGINLGGRELTMETGRIAKQADGAVLVSQGETVVLVTAVSAREAKEGASFFPLTVDYREYGYAAGRIPGGYFKREGRPTEREILTSRLTDRPIRPLFPTGYQFETQIISMVISADDVHDEALRRLFEEERDAITLIKWKEVLDLLEEATDRCEDVANVLESVVVKHG